MYSTARGDGKNDPRTNGEYWLLDHVLKASCGPQTLLDIGANHGDWTAQALRSAHASREMRIHAFEPVSETRSMLAKRFSKNSEVTVQAYALSDASGVATFYSSQPGAGTNSLSPMSGSNAEIVRQTTVDDFLQETGDESTLMVKIDTEGFDLLVLRGAEKMLSEGRIEIIQFEYNWRWLINHSCLRDVFELIEGRPYRFGKLVGKTIEFFNQWHFELDRYFENNYVLVRRDSHLLRLGTSMTFDRSNVAIRC